MEGAWPNANWEVSTHRAICLGTRSVPGRGCTFRAKELAEGRTQPRTPMGVRVYLGIMVGFLGTNAKQCTSGINNQCRPMIARKSDLLTPQRPIQTRDWHRSPTRARHTRHVVSRPGARWFQDVDGVLPGVAC